MLEIAVLTFVFVVLLGVTFTFMRAAIEAFRDVCLPFLAGAANGTASIAEALRARRDDTLRSMAGGGNVWVGWRIMGALVYFFAFAAFLVADAGIMALVFETWGFSRAPDFLRENSNVFLLATLLSTIAFWGLVFLDSIGATRLAPWREVEAPWPARFRALALMAVGFGVLTLLLLGLWRGIRLIDEEVQGGVLGLIDDGVPVFTQAVMVALAGGAALLGGWALPAFLAVAFAVLVALAEWIARLITFLLRLIAGAVINLARALTAVLRVPAYIGAQIWNWFIRIVGRYIGLREVNLDDILSPPPPVAEWLPGAPMLRPQVGPSLAQAANPSSNPGNPTSEATRDEASDPQ